MTTKCFYSYIHHQWPLFASSLWAGNSNLVKMIFTLILTLSIPSGPNILMPQQLCCCGMYKIVTWRDNYFLCKNNICNFARFKLLAQPAHACVVCLKPPRVSSVMPSDSIRIRQSVTFDEPRWQRHHKRSIKPNQDGRDTTRNQSRSVLTLNIQTLRMFLKTTFQWQVSLDESKKDLNDVMGKIILTRWSNNIKLSHRQWRSHWTINLMHWCIYASLGGVSCQ